MAPASRYIFRLTTRLRRAVLHWPRGTAGAAAVVLALVLWAAPAAHAYIGPGAGFAVLGSFLVVVAALVLGGMVLLTWPVRALVRSRRRRRAFARSRVRRVVVLGFDGMDPEVAERMMAAGRLPNLAALARRGTYRRLATTCPAMSPVAWSSFATGTGPGRHGIHDFLHRDPRTYLPTLSSARVRPPRRVLRAGPLAVPLGKPSLSLLRRSRPFWSVLGEHGILSTVLRVPITFPPEPFPGLLLAGLCVPDLRGTQGSFTAFSSAGAADDEPIGGRRLPLSASSGAYRGVLPGPARLADPGGRPAEAPFRLVPEGEGAARLEIGGRRLRLRLGEHSEWTPISFSIAPGVRAGGMCRFLLRSLAPHLELYASPINIDPERPALPISHPPAFAVYLAKRLGRFATLGVAEDTWARNEGVLDDQAFLEQCRLSFEERRRMLLASLENLRAGCLVCVFDTTDRVQHLYWRCREAGNPAAGEAQSESAEAVEAAYEQADGVVGEVAARLGEQEALLVLSDHGFTAFRRGVNLNAWLMREGYLALQPGEAGEREWLQGVDWGRTRAYALGLGGLYLNLEGREAQGVVPAEEAAALKEELAARLAGLRDDETGEVAIARVFDTARVNPGPYRDLGPDLLVGYARGWRYSWGAAQGRVAGPVFEENVRPWSGDHCCDPELVPGVLFSSIPLGAGPAQIADLAPTLLELFGISPPAYMQGRSLLPTAAGGEGNG